MTTYKIGMTFVVKHEYVVEADNESDAKSKAEELSCKDVREYNDYSFDYIFKEER
jgi:hypothetical protein